MKQIKKLTFFVFCDIIWYNLNIEYKKNKNPMLYILPHSLRRMDIENIIFIKTLTNIFELQFFKKERNY